MSVSVERRGWLRNRHWVARCSETGMVAYDKRRDRALMRLVTMHAMVIKQLRVKAAK